MLIMAVALVAGVVGIGLITYINDTIFESMELSQPSSLAKSSGAKKPATLKEVISNSVAGFKKEQWKKSWNPGGVDEIRDAPNELKTKYVPVWQSLLKKKNGIADDYLKRHIEIVDTGVTDDKTLEAAQGGPAGGNSAAGHEYFEVLYKVKKGWIALYAIDSFAIKNPGSDNYLEEAQIENNQSAPAWYHNPTTKIASFSPTETPNLTFEEAVQKLKQVHPKLEPEYLSLDYESGGIILGGLGTNDDKANSCVKGSYNLQTGKGDVKDYWCRIE